MNHKISTYVLIGCILLIGGLYIISAFSSEDLDDVCLIDNSTLLRTSGLWGCGNISIAPGGDGGNPFDQSLNTTDDVTFNSGSFYETIGIKSLPASNIGVGVQMNVNSSTTNYGVYGGVFNNYSSGNPSAMYGLDFYTQWNPLGAVTSRTISLLDGVRTQVRLVNEIDSIYNIKATNARGYDSRIFIDGSRNTSVNTNITTAIDYYAGSGIVTNGTLVTKYAFFDDGQTQGLTNWGFYGKSTNNALIGKLSIGKTTYPNSTLDVNGNVSVLGFINSTMGYRVNLNVGISRNITIMKTAILTCSMNFTGGILYASDC